MAKIEEKELESIQQLIMSMNSIKEEIGRLELEKIAVASRYDNVAQSLQERRAALQEKYGEINVNLSTGEYEEIKEE